MGKFVNGILFLGGILAIGLVLSGYKENFELSPSKFPSDLVQSMISSDNDFMKKTKVCRPGFDCRRVNFYCSNS